MVTVIDYHIKEPQKGDSFIAPLNFIRVSGISPLKPRAIAFYSQINLLFLNAIPEPDFKYFSKLYAEYLLGKDVKHFNLIGNL